jgi:hypothetical protein
MRREREREGRERGGRRREVKSDTADVYRNTMTSYLALNDSRSKWDASSLMRPDWKRLFSIFEEKQES